jgi:carboxylesterase
MSLPRPFTAPEHLPFYWQGRGTAFVLIHGFPGSPAEMRPLAAALRAANAEATLAGCLLPGFGPEVEAMEQYGMDDWLRVVDDLTARLLAEHDRVFLIGNSMGASLALQTALHHEVSGLILFAPFWRAPQRWIDLLFPLLRPWLGTMRPFAKADFADPAFVQSVRRILGDGADLEDAAVQAAVRALPLPVHALGQALRTGHCAARLAPHIRQPVLVFQGSDDPVAHPRIAQRVLARLRSLKGYLEVSADHDLIRSDLVTLGSIPAMIDRFVQGHARPLPSLAQRPQPRPGSTRRHSTSMELEGTAHVL